MSRYYNDVNSFDDIDDFYLEHFGIKGMKWKNHIYAIKDKLKKTNKNAKRFRDLLKYSRPGDYKINNIANRTGHATLQTLLKNGGAKAIKEDNARESVAKRKRRMDKNTAQRLSGSERKKYKDSFNKDVRKKTNDDIRDLIKLQNDNSKNAAAATRARRKKDYKAAARLNSSLYNFVKKYDKRHKMN